MRTNPFWTTRNLILPVIGILTPLLGFALVYVPAQSAIAELPAPGSAEFRGMYKVAASTDPIFPMQESQQWFLDFGNGISAGSLSGNVAVSLRQNPNVKVRIMVWQYFPQEGSLLIGNPYEEGSNKAVAKGVWKLQATSQGVIFHRGGYEVVLERVLPGEY